MFKRWLVKFGLGTACALGLMTSLALAADLSGAGATFPYPVYAKWADSYKAESGVGLNYQSIGSGGGIKQIKAETVTFGASDMPLKPEELAQSGLVQWPQIIGGIVPVLNVSGLKPGEMVLDAPTLAAIYLGEVKDWDAPEIAKLNPKTKLPHQPIVPVYRADGSGTTFLFTHFLSASEPKFASQVGNSTAVEWPVGIGAKGNEGVANTAKQTAGAIGYVEYAYAKQNNLVFARMRNKEGKVVTPNNASFQAAAAAADWNAAPGFYKILTNQGGQESWPIVGASFILMPKKPRDALAARQALAFFDWAFKKGGAAAEALDYVPMPEKAVEAIRRSWAGIEEK